MKGEQNVFIKYSMYGMGGGPSTHQLSSEIKAFRDNEERKANVKKSSNADSEFMMKLINSQSAHELEGTPYDISVWNQKTYDKELPNAIETNDDTLLFYLGQIFKSSGGPDTENKALQTRENLLKERDKILNDALEHVAQQHNMTVDELSKKISEERNLRFLD